MVPGPAAPGSGLTEVCRLNGDEERVWCVAWRPDVDPPQLASCGSSRLIRFWGPSSANGSTSWELLGEIDATERHTRTLRALAWDPSGDALAVAAFDATTSLWRGPKALVNGGLSFECKGLVAGHENEVKGAAFSASGDYLATCSRDKSVWIFETEPNFEYECVSVLQSHTQDVKMVRWHPSQDVLFSCSYDDTVKVWGPDGDDWSCKETLAVHESTVWGLVFDPTGARFATCSDDRTIRVWAPGAADSGPEGSSPSAPSAAGAGAWRPGTVPVAAAAYVGPLFRLSSLPAPPPAAAPAAADDTEAKPAEEPQPPADAACSWRCTSVIKGVHPRPIYSVDWLRPAACGDLLASACGDNHVRVFRPVGSGRAGEAWSCAAEVEAHRGDANCVAWCPTLAPGGAAWLASAGDDGEVAVWRYEC